VIDFFMPERSRYPHRGTRIHLSRSQRKTSVLPVIAVTLLVSFALGTATAWGITVPATKDLSCVAARISEPNCTANDFEVITTFSAAPNTPPFCIEGESFEFEIDVNLTSNQADRYDIGFFFGQNRNDPANDTSNNCSVATFPTSFIPSAPPSATQPWGNIDNKNTCSDFYGGGSIVTRVNKIKVMCQGNSTGELLVPYTLVYSQNAGSATSCTGPGNVKPGSKSKCQGNTSASVSGIVKVFSGAYVDVTKQTSPDGESQSFSYTATGPPGSSVIAVTNATSWSPLTGGTYTPAAYADATNSVTVSLSDGQTARFLISALDTEQTLTITEAATAGWNSTAAISCAAVAGSPPLTTNDATRTITAGLSKTNLAAACTVTNSLRLPNLTVLKTAFGVASGANARSGQDIPYQITVTNTGTGTTSNVIIQDRFSPYVSWKLGSLLLTQGTPPSGLTLTFPPASLFYSYNNGPWVSTAPVSGGGGAPAGYDGTVTGIKIDLTAAGTMDANNAAFIINYLTKVK